MMNQHTERSAAVEKARDYYNSSDADNFYFHVWGGEDIHVGIYQSDDEAIADASRRTVATLFKELGTLPDQAKVLDVGAGYGGSARWLARHHGLRVTALNLSEVENERDRELNQKQGLTELIDVVDGDFESLPFAANTFDAVWSQDAILHSGDRQKVFGEIDRVLKPGGSFVFTDILQREDASSEALQPVYDRIHLSNLGSVAAYDSYAVDLGWAKVGFTAMPGQLPRHYQKVHDILQNRYEELSAFISTAYLDRMQEGLRHWVKAGQAGHLSWGILHYRKAAVS